MGLISGMMIIYLVGCNTGVNLVYLSTGEIKTISLLGECRDIQKIIHPSLGECLLVTEGSTINLFKFN